MKKEKTLSELYKLILKEIEKEKDYFSICDVTNGLFCCNIINRFEMSKIQKHLSENKPKHLTSPYWWKTTDKDSRIEFLKEMIEKTK